MITKEAWAWAGKALKAVPGTLKSIGNQSVKDSFSPMSMGINGFTLASGMDGAANTVGGFVGGSMGYNAANRIMKKLPIPGPAWLRNGLNFFGGGYAAIKGSTLANKVTNKLPQLYKRELPKHLQPYQY